MEPSQPHTRNPKQCRFNYTINHEGIYLVWFNNKYKEEYWYCDEHIIKFINNIIKYGMNRYILSDEVNQMYNIFITHYD